jgi:hypothetical protein
MHNVFSLGCPIFDAALAEYILGLMQLLAVVDLDALFPRK